jgi:hypothetical protein
MPWARSEESGYAAGGNKFDLEKWDDAYFDRLNGFIEQARKLGIIVEVTIFCSMYTDENWSINPFNPVNNVNELQIDDYRKINTIDNGPFMAVQTRLVQTIVRELNQYPNLFYEIQNEPWGDQRVETSFPNTRVTGRRNQRLARTGPVTDAADAWEAKIAELIQETEGTLPNKHLIAQNFGNQGHPIESVSPRISILNFHYAWPDAVTWNYGWDRVIGFDESGFAGPDDDVYRAQAWRFMLSGGGLFNSLDYSFYVGKEDGTGPNTAGGGGSSKLRKQLAILSRLLHSLNLVTLQPDCRFVKLAPGCVVHGLSDPGKQYVAFIEGTLPDAIQLNLLPGSYQGEWIDVFGNEEAVSWNIERADELLSVAPPKFGNEIALRIEVTQ